MGIQDGTPTGEALFNLAFGTEAVIPWELGYLPFLQTERYDLAVNNDHLQANLDLLENTKEQPRMRTAAYQWKVTRYYNSHIKESLFRPGDLVLRKAEISQPKEIGKFAPKWEGPYQVTEIVRQGTY